MGTPAPKAFSATAAGSCPPPISTASRSASAAVAAGSDRALASCVATNEMYRRPPCSFRTASGSAETSKPPDTSSTTGVVPASTVRISTCKPAMWCAGSASSHPPGPPSRAWVAEALAVNAAAVNIAPFGTPAVPDVDTTSAMSSSIGSPAPKAVAITIFSFFSCTREAGTGSTEQRPASRSSRTGSRVTTSGPAGTSTARSVAIRRPQCHVDRRAAILWPPTASAPFRCRRATEARR